MTDLIRMGEVVALREGESSAVGTLTGYFAVFNQQTLIDNPFEGRFYESIAPGAFTKTLAERGRDVQVLFNHGLDPSVGMRPLGVPSSIRQDDHGVYAEVPLDDTSYNRDIAASLRSGALRGQLFRFGPIRSTDGAAVGSDKHVIRTEVSLTEFGPVTFPAYGGSDASLRSLLDVMPVEVVEQPLLERLTADLDARIADLFPELRAGKVLSSENEALVRKAVAALSALLDKARATPPTSLLALRADLAALALI